MVWWKVNCWPYISRPIAYFVIITAHGGISTSIQCSQQYASMIWMGYITSWVSQFEILSSRLARALFRVVILQLLSVRVKRYPVMTLPKRYFEIAPKCWIYTKSAIIASRAPEYQYIEVLSWH